MRIPVPVAELAPQGELEAAPQVRLMQLAAARASAAAGFDDQWYARNGSTWVVRYTDIELIARAGHGEELDIRTWVSDIRRVRSWRHYEITRVEDDVLLTRAKTDWVFVDAKTSAPAAIPDELQVGLMPDGVVTEARPKRIQLPPGSNPRPTALRRVEWADLDSLGHVNNSGYAAFVEQALLDKLAQSGWSPALDAAAAHLRARQLEIEYLTPALFRQLLSFRAALSVDSEQELCATIEILADDQPAARAIGKWRWSHDALPAPIVEAAKPE